MKRDIIFHAIVWSMPFCQRGKEGTVGQKCKFLNGHIHADTKQNFFCMQLPSNTFTILTFLIRVA